MASPGPVWTARSLRSVNLRNSPLRMVDTAVAQRPEPVRPADFVRAWLWPGRLPGGVYERELSEEFFAAPDRLHTVAGASIRVTAAHRGARPHSDGGPALGWSPGTRLVRPGHASRASAGAGRGSRPALD